MLATANPHQRQGPAPWSRLVVCQDSQEQTRCGITPEISSHTAALGKIAFKWTIIKTLLMLQVLSGFSETNHRKWFLVPQLKISRKNLNSSFAKIITRPGEKYPGLLMTEGERHWKMSLLPSDVTYLGKLLSLTVRYNLVIYYPLQLFVQKLFVFRYLSNLTKFLFECHIYFVLKLPQQTIS